MFASRWQKIISHFDILLKGIIYIQHTTYIQHSAYVVITSELTFYINIVFKRGMAVLYFFPQSLSLLPNYVKAKRRRVLQALKWSTENFDYFLNLKEPFDIFVNIIIFALKGTKNPAPSRRSTRITYTHTHTLIPQLESKE